MLDMIKEDRSTQRRWDGTAFEPDPYLWAQLKKEKPEEICRKALVSYEHEKGFLLPFLNQTFQVLPAKRAIIPLCRHAPAIKSFELDHILLTYLLRVKAIDIGGKTVNEKQIPGGEAFFRGPHSLNTRPIEEIFGEDRDAFLSVGKKLKGKVMKLGDAGICLPVLPRIPVILILWLKDDEFPAVIKVGFDSTISSHLPLDIIWAMVNVISKWMTLYV